MLEPQDQLRKPGSCGLPAPLVEVKLFDDDGNEVTGTGPEATGELFVKSSSVFDDYYKQHDKYEADNKHGYQTVGDIAYRDDEGYIYICDRKKDMIISGGMNVYPAEIEAALEAHPDVLEAAVFGIPSEEWGELVHAVIVAARGRHRRRGGHPGARPRAPRQLQDPALDQLERRAAEDRLGQDPQARPARPVLGGPDVQRLRSNCTANADGAAPEGGPAAFQQNDVRSSSKVPRSSPRRQHPAPSCRCRACPRG